MTTTTRDKKTIKKLTIEEKVALVEKAKGIPYTLSDEEVDAILDEAYAAGERGDKEERLRILAKLPIGWEAAVATIEVFGVEELLEMGLDLRYAVAVLGESFVYGQYCAMQCKAMGVE